MSILHLWTTYFPTLKEDPAGADIASHRLLVRAGMIRQMGSGTYTFLPLGMRVLEKVEHIVREEMNATQASEILMPILQPAQLWHESGRWDDYGPEMMRLVDRHDHQICLGPTHEELITDLVRDELRSYKDLPCVMWQMQVKFRDEIRPRFGLFRTREFIMKDAYSFDADEKSLDKTYRQMEVAYARICERLGLDYRLVEADPGQIGGSETVEFMALSRAGESDLLHCSCGYAADAEAASANVKTTLASGARKLEKIETPGVHTIAELAIFLDIPETSTVKALCGADVDGKVYALFIPGDHELNDIKIGRLVEGWRMLEDDEMLAAGLHKGSIGPIGLPEDVVCICDASLKKTHAWAVGANDDGYHYLGAEPGRDFTPDAWEDLVLAKAGDICPDCGKTLNGSRGIEVGQVFKLGTKYSKAMNANYMAQDGTEKPYLMGSYGFGITRSMAAVVEQRNDDSGIYWPISIAPAEICILPLQMGDDLVEPLARKMAEELEEAGIEVAIDDRTERAGVKFADADLVGWPYQLIIGKRGAAQGSVEFTDRATKKKVELSVDEALAFMVEAIKSAHRALRATTTQM